MSKYRVHRLKENARQQFRWTPHTIGITVARPKDYEQVADGEADTPYELWESLKQSKCPLELGDILESESGELRIYKYVGFEEAQWQVLEAKTNSDEATAATETKPAI